MQTTTFNVNGMTCGGCVTAVRNVLSAVDGAEKVDVSLEKHSATIQFDEHKTDLSHLKSAVVAKGYGTEDVAAKNKGCCG